MMIFVFVFGIFVVFANSASATNWKPNPNQCPTTYNGQIGNPGEVMCGLNSGVAHWYDMTTLVGLVPAGNTTVNTGGGTYGGYVVDCDAFDASVPRCDNTGSFWCSPDATCNSAYRKTECIGTKWATDSGSSNCDVCQDNRWDCDTNNTCETADGASCTATLGGNNVPGTMNCVTGAGSCSDLGATLATCTCVPGVQYFQTGIQAQFATTSPLLWGTQYGTGDLINISSNDLSTTTFMVSNSGQVGVGLASAINTNVAFEVSSTNRGVLLPRLTTTQRNAILTPPESLLVYNIDNHQFEYYATSSWLAMGSGGGSFTETDPIWMTASGTLTTAHFATNTVSQWSNDAGYLTSYTTTSPAGINGQVQFNDNGAFGATNTLVWDNLLGSLSVGDNYTFLSGSRSFVQGLYSQATGTNSIAMGQYAQATNNFAVAIGGSSPVSSGNSSIAMGSGAHAYGNSSIALGNLASAENLSSVAIGYQTRSTGNYAVAIGGNTRATGLFSVAIGNNSTSSGNSSFVGGYNNDSSGNYSAVFGSDNINTGGDYAFISGDNNVNSGGLYSAIFGAYNTSTGQYSFIGAGLNSVASGINSVAFGRNLTVSGNYSFGVNAHGSNSYTLSQANTVALMGGNVGVGTTTPAYRLTVSGDFAVTGTIRVGNAMTPGTYGQLLMSTGTGAVWMSTSSLGLGGGGVTGSGTSTEVAFWSGTNSLSSSSSLYWNNTNGRLGINNATPEFALTIGNDGGIIATGTVGSGATLSTAGAGTRMIWYPRKAAFRAGYVNGTQWNDANIGEYSVAMGNGSRASGYGDIAIGTGVVASGGNSATAIGALNTASGDGAFALGRSMTVSGDYSFGVNVSTTGATLSQASTIALMGGNVGVGTTSPLFKLTIDGGIYSTGTFNAGETLSYSGAGTRMIWYPRKAAFRAGNVDSTQWNDANIGTYSVAFGEDTEASGDHGSTAFGTGSIASGDYGSAAFGSWTEASGQSSAAFNIATIASGNYSTAFGNTTVASGMTATAFGNGTTASGYISTVFGNSMTVSGDYSFGVNVGASASPVLSQANTIALMGGNVGIGTTSPQYRLTVAGDLAVTGTIRVGDTMASGTYGQILMSTGTGATWMSTSSLGLGAGTVTGSGTSTEIAFWSGTNSLSSSSSLYWNNTTGKLGINNSNPEFALTIGNDGGIIATGTYGSGTILTTAGAGTRMIWYPYGAAFRAGIIDGTQWNEFNIGHGSVAFGANTIASGAGSMAVGADTVASNASSFASGYGAVASGYVGSSIGLYTTSSGHYGSFSIGERTVASGNRAFAGGYYSIASGTATLAFGQNANALGNNSVALGQNVTTTLSSSNNFALGNNIIVSGNYSFGVNVSSTVATLAQANTIALMGGNVGIGTTSPPLKLTIDATVGSGGSEGIGIFGGNSTTVALGNYNSGGTYTGVLALYRSDYWGPTAMFSAGGSASLYGFHIGTSTIPSTISRFTVGSDLEFAISSDGDITRINDVPMSWPSSQGGVGTILQNDGSGNLSWEATSSLGLIDGEGSAGFVTLWNSSTTLSYDGDGMYWDGMDNRLGIGTTTPLGRLHMRTNISGDGIFLSNDVGKVASKLFLILDSDSYQSGKLSLLQNDVEKVSLVAKGNSYLTGGNVGIGTSTPETVLSVAVPGNNGIVLYGSTNGYQLAALASGAGNETGGLVLFTNNISQPSVSITGGVGGAITYFGTSTYRFGIATSSPLSGFTFVVAGTSSQRSILPETNLTYTLGDSSKRWNELWTGTANIGTSTWSLTTTGADRFGIFSGPSGTATETISILQDLGNVGINNISPSKTLDVNGSINIPSTDTTTDSGIIYMNSSRFIHSVGGTTNFYAGLGSANTNAISDYNTGIGGNALMNITSGDGANVAVGYNAGRSITTGAYNVGIGINNFYENGGGIIGNVAIGRHTMYSTQSNSSTAVGYAAMRNNTTGEGNVALGYYGLYANSTGNYNTAVGFEALATTTNSNNTALGYQALYGSRSGARNVGVGVQSLYSLTSGSDNTALGYNALYGITSGSYNVGVGPYSLSSISGTTITNNTAIGQHVMRDAVGTTMYYNVAIGYEALRYLSVSTATDNVAIGRGSMSNASGTPTINYNIAIGRESLLNTETSDSVAIGAYALRYNTTGDGNVAIGYEALELNDTGSYNTALGYRALATNDIAIGGSNVAVGYSALEDSSNGVNNTALGSSALSNLTSGSYNVAIGSQSGNDVIFSTENGNTLIGYATDILNGVEYSTALGYSAVASTSNSIYLGQLGNGNGRVFFPGIYGSVPAATNYVCINPTTREVAYQSTACGSSDDNLKINEESIADEIDVLNAVKQLRGVFFNWDLSNPEMMGAPSDRQIGVIAQEVLPILPEVVEYSEDWGYYSVDYPKLTAFLIEVAKAQQNILDPITESIFINTTTLNMAFGSSSTPYNLTTYGNLSFILPSDSTSTHKISFSNTVDFESSVSSTPDSRAFIFNALNFDTTSTDKYILSLRSNNNPVFSVSSNGDVHSSGNMYAASAVLGTSTNPGDLAEKVDINPTETVEAGDVMMVDPASPDRYQKSNQAYEPTVAGVISTNPTIIVGNGKTDQTAPLAMVGRVPVKFSEENGAIQRGDLLVSASTPGYAMKYDPILDNSRKVVGIIGIALDNSMESTNGKIMTLIRTGWVYNKTQAVSNLEQQVYYVASSAGVDLSVDPELMNIETTSEGSITYNSDSNLSLNNFSITNVKSIISTNNKWTIDEYGLLITKVITAEGTEKNIYGMTSESAEITLSGSAELINGEAIINFATDTQWLIDETQEIKVIPALTSGDCNGIFVSEKSSAGFTIKELNSGTSASTFDWLVIAKRKINIQDEIIYEPTPTPPIDDTPTTTPLVDSPTTTPPIDTSISTPPTSTPSIDPPTTTPSVEASSSPDETAMDES